MKLRLPVLAPVIVIAMTLSGCAAATVPAATTTASAGPTRAPALVPTPRSTTTSSTTGDSAGGTIPAGTASAIQLTADTLTVLGENGEVLQVLSYYQPKADVVAALTELFGFAPQPTQRPSNVPLDGGTRALDYEGFLIVDSNIDDYRGFTFIAMVTVPGVRGITIETVDGIRVGSAVAPIAAKYGSQPTGTPSEVSITFTAGAYKVTLVGNDPNGTITSIVTPAGA
jgi:hypothetical protein